MSSSPATGADAWTVGALVAELRALRAEMAELREAHDAMARELMAPSDRRLGAALVPLLAEMLGAEEFTAADLAAHALNARTPEAAALRDLIKPMVTETGGVRSLGRALARLANREFCGARLTLAAERRGVQWWRVRVSGA